MLWKIYFFLLLIITILGILQYPYYSPLAFGDWRSIAESIILILGTYSYVFNKRLISKQIFMLFLLTILVFWPMDLVDIFLGDQRPDPFGSLFDNNVPINEMQKLLALILGLPGVYAIYKYIKSK